MTSSSVQTSDPSIQVYNLGFRCVHGFVRNPVNCGLIPLDPEDRHIENVTTVINFLRNRLGISQQKINLDYTPIVSYINCANFCTFEHYRHLCSRNCDTVSHHEEEAVPYPNAHFHPPKGWFFYGQKDDFDSFSNSLSIVAHEMFHKVTSNIFRCPKNSSQKNIRLSLALNESYSDIFAVFVTHYSINSWNWVVGESFLETPRDISIDPRIDYAHIDEDDPNIDYYHISKIHSYAIVDIVNRINSIQPTLVTKIPEICHRALNDMKTSKKDKSIINFTDSRSAIETKARSMFKQLGLPRPLIIALITQFEEAFDAAGIPTKHSN